MKFGIGQPMVALHVRVYREVFGDGEEPVLAGG